MSDDQLVDNRLDISSQPDFPLPYPSDFILNPNRFQTIVFPIDTNPAKTFGSLISVVSGTAGSVFGNGDPGDEYYLETEDGTGSLTNPTLGTDTYTSPIGDVQFIITSGSVPFSAGDRISFDVFPTIGDVLLRQDELPVFTRDASGNAVDFITNAKTAL